jgi:hypothetical protein
MALERQKCPTPRHSCTVIWCTNDGSDAPGNGPERQNVSGGGTDHLFVLISRIFDTLHHCHGKGSAIGRVGLRTVGMKQGLAVLALLCGMASSAEADVTATFADKGRLRTVIEAASDGSARIKLDSGGMIDQGYTLIRDGKVYQVSPAPGGPVAVLAEAEAYSYRQRGARRDHFYREPP